MKIGRPEGKSPRCQQRQTGMWWDRRAGAAVLEVGGEQDQGSQLRVSLGQKKKTPLFLKMQHKWAEAEG